MADCELNAQLGHENRRAVRILVATLALALGGCSASEIVQDWNAAPGTEQPQPDYRRVVAEHIRTVFPEDTRLGELEISGARQVDHLKGQAWLTCLKLDAQGHPQHYAIFIQGDQIIDFRAGVVIDQCHNASYTPFAIETAAKKPATERRVGRGRRSVIEH